MTGRPTEGDAIHSPFRFPNPFRHDPPPVQDANALFESELTFGQRAADRIAAVMGSWPFILVQSAILAGWIALNVAAWIRHWDPYPFILPNLFLSLQAAYAAPIIMMSQNRQAAKDRLETHHDFVVDRKAEEEVRAILNHLAAQDAALVEIHRLLVERPPGGASREAAA